MAKPLRYAQDCRRQFGQNGQETDYAKCILRHAHRNSAKNAQRVAGDRDVVRRATGALVRLHGQYPAGVPGDQMLALAGFTTYNGPTDGLWPWLEEYGGLGVVQKMPGPRYRIVPRFHQALVRALA